MAQLDKTIGTMHLKQEGDVYIVTMNGGENRFNDNSIRDLLAVFDIVEKYVYIVGERGER